MRETLEVKFEKKDGKSGRKSHRAAIRFAPGPYGEVFTNWYTGQRGAESVVDQLRSALAQPTTSAEG